MVDSDVLHLSWDEWYRRFAARYRVGRDTAQHVTILGPTGTGKTTLAMQVARLRRYVVVLGCKPRDAELSRWLHRDGYHVQRGAVLPSPGLHRRVAVWPRYRGVNDRTRQRDTFGAVFGEAFRLGGWHIVAEELPHLIDLGLERHVVQHLRMGRSMSSGLIVCAQRPRGIPLTALSSASHLLMFGTSDMEDLRRLGELNGVDPARVRAAVARLGRSYDFVHVDLGDGSMVASRYRT